MTGWKFGIGLFAVVTAGLSAQDALHGWARGAASEEVPNSETTQLLSPDIRPERVRNIAAQAVRALKAEPLDIDAMRQLAIARERAREGSGETTLALAERISRRDMLTQAVLLDKSAHAGDLAATLRHYDALLLRMPELAEALAPKLAAVLDDDAARIELRRYAQRPWFDGFLGASLHTASNPGDVAELMLATGRLQRGKPGDTLVPALLGALLAKGEVGEARSIVGRLSAGHVELLQDMRLGTATTDIALAPLTWTLANDNDAHAALTESGSVGISITAGSRSAVLTRMTLLPPGKYGFEQKVAYERPPLARLSWLVSCAMPDNNVAIWQQDLPARAGAVTYRSQITIPAGCESQRWQLWARGEDGQAQSTARLGNLRLVQQ